VPERRSQRGRSAGRAGALRRRSPAHRARPRWREASLRPSLAARGFESRLRPLPARRSGRGTGDPAGICRPDRGRCLSGASQRL